MINLFRKHSLANEVNHLRKEKHLLSNENARLKADLKGAIQLSVHWHGLYHKHVPARDAQGHYIKRKPS